MAWICACFQAARHCSTSIDPISKHKTNRAGRRLYRHPPAQVQRQPSNVTLCVADSKYDVVKVAGRCVCMFGLNVGGFGDVRSHAQWILAFDRTLGMRLVEADDDRCNIYWSVGGTPANCNESIPLKAYVETKYNQ